MSIIIMIILSRNAGIIVNFTTEKFIRLFQIPQERCSGEFLDIQQRQPYTKNIPSDPVLFCPKKLYGDSDYISFY